ncbi:hypothetical protein [Candidatus Rariloculus sp.]|uniref:hypothetical protein n=1 Tax=Candidatus Rariloculus sp. TaxID=3101265 RepID=UPI003D0B8E59
MSPHREIRDLAIEDPFYTYCANHPHRRPERDPIPIGPVMRHGGFDGIASEKPRCVWKPSPDSEDIRQHLLGLLGSIFEHVAKDSYPLGNSLARTIIWQLGEFREQRAVRNLEWIRDNCPQSLADPAAEALATIRGEQ